MRNNRELGGGFWTFETPLEPHFEVPTPGDLVESWQTFHGIDAHHLGDDFYGIYETTDRPPAAVVSLDLCEVVRETGLSMERLHKVNSELGSYASEIALYSDWQTIDLPDQTKNRLLIQQLMHHDYVKPVPYSDVVQTFLQKWRASGVYVIANTSTLPGCEASTVRFLSETYPNSVRGILLPRNFDNTGQVTKASIFEHFKDRVTRKTGFDFTSVPSIAIEDASHHAAVLSVSSQDMHVFMPAYTWNESLEDTTNITRVEQNFGTLDTFIAANDYLIERGIIS